MIYELSQQKVESKIIEYIFHCFIWAVKRHLIISPSWASFNESGFESEIFIILQGRDYIVLLKGGRKGYGNEVASWKLVSRWWEMADAGVSLSCEQLTEEDPSSGVLNMGAWDAKSEIQAPSLLSSMSPSSLIGNIQWIRDAWWWCFHAWRWSIMSLLVKSGWGRGKRVKKGEGNTFISTGYWVLVMTIDYSHHRAVTASQHWLNGYISSTSSQISPDGWLWEFRMSYNCSGPGKPDCLTV